MGARTAGLAASLATVALWLVAAAPASATSCAAPDPAYDAFRSADLVAEGVLLSGPSRDGILFSPARLAVTRYLKGSGPAVLRVGTLGNQIATGDVSDIVALGFGGSFARVGQSWRIFGSTSRRDRRLYNDGGVTSLGAVCSFDDRLLSPTRLLVPVPGTTRRAGAGRDRWRARLFRTSNGVRCVRFGLHPRRGSAHGECRRGAHGTLVAVRRRGAGQGATTAVALAGPGLRSVSVRRLRDGFARETAASGGVALAVLDGVSEPGDLEIVARYADGTRRDFGRAALRATVPDSATTPTWAADHERGRGDRPCVTLVQPDDPDRTTQPSDHARHGECARRREAPFLAVRRSLEHPEGSRDGVVAQTLVFGAAGSSVTEVSVRGPDGERAAGLSRRGRAFLAVFSGPVSPAQLTVRLRYANGTETTWSGRRSVNVAPPARDGN
jgi:hypothetical protein